MVVAAVKFSEYCEIMQTRKIQDLFFIYNGREYVVGVSPDNFLGYVHGEPLKVVYRVDYENAVFNSFDELLQAPVFEGNTLEEIWQEIEYVTFDDKSEQDFIAQLDCSTTFEEEMESCKQVYLEENGLTQKKIFWSPARSYLYECGWALLGIVLFNVLLLIPGLCGSGWNYMLIMAFADAITIPVALFALWKTADIVSYTITDRKIEVYDGMTHITRYDNIRKITMRKYRRKQGYGRIQIYVKKGLSINFRMVHVPDVEAVYQLLMDNWQNSKNHIAD